MSPSIPFLVGRERHPDRKPTAMNAANTTDTVTSTLSGHYSEVKLSDARKGAKKAYNKAVRAAGRRTCDDY